MQSYNKEEHDSLISELEDIISQYEGLPKSSITSRDEYQGVSGLNVSRTFLLKEMII